MNDEIPYEKMIAVSTVWAGLTAVAAAEPASAEAVRGWPACSTAASWVEASADW